MVQVLSWASTVQVPSQVDTTQVRSSGTGVMSTITPG